MRKLLLAVTRNPKTFALSLFFGLTSLWAILEPFITICFPDINRLWFILGFIILSIIIALIRTFPRSSIKIDLKNTNSSVFIKFGNFFDQNGVLAIAVNEYFDSEIGKPVSEKSIHGFLIKNILGGKHQIFDEAINISLGSSPFIENNRSLGKSKRFPIGSTASLEFGDKKYLIFAMSRTDENYEAHTDPSLLLQGLDGLFAKARAECNGHDLNLPLVGTGLSKSGIPPKYIIDLILISILKSTKQSEITRTINIIIEDSRFDQLDLNEIKRKWN